jgi:hypothetical protein
MEAHVLEQLDFDLSITYKLDPVDEIEQRIVQW